MEIYSKADKEFYLNNGHYKVNKVEYMSIWTFKRYFSLRNNNPIQNVADSNDLRKQGIPRMQCTPDEGNSKIPINIYPITILKLYYQV